MYSVNSRILATRDYHRDLPSSYTFHAQLRRFAYVGEGTARHVLAKGDVLRMGIQITGHRKIRGVHPAFFAFFQCKVETDAQ